MRIKINQSLTNFQIAGGVDKRTVKKKSAVETKVSGKSLNAKIKLLIVMQSRMNCGGKRL